MSPGLPPLDAVDVSRDLVFVSYSHADVEWWQWLEVLLKPVVRARRLRLWADPYIPVGDDWHRDITAAIERTRVALLLVSRDFLASDFIMDEELPALITRGVQLAPVLLGDCLWTHVPELARVQWLHDPGRDGALKLVSDREGERDRRLTAVCARLIALVPEDGAAHPAPAQPPVVVGALPVEAVASGPGLGLLDGVPGLPPGYLARDELGALIDAVVSTETGAVGLSGDVAALGLHGQGGIGKSVLACALARDEGVRARFPDGVYWVSVGEHADVLAVQLELLARLGAADRAPRSPDEAHDQLAEVLHGRGALLVVDDVWSVAAALALRVTGPRGRVLYTSRDPQVLTAAGAQPHRVEVLSPAAARVLAGGVLGVSPESLPAAADRAFQAVGRVALAIALLAAAVRGGRTWGQVAEELARGAGIFGDHPYANTFKAMQLAVGALRDDLAPALLSLAVFSPDTPIPVPAIARYWAHTRGRSAQGMRCDLRELAAANVLSLDEGTDGAAVVGFHDLQHDYCCCTPRSWRSCTPGCSPPTGHCSPTRAATSGGNYPHASPTSGTTWSRTCAARRSTTPSRARSPIRRIWCGGSHAAARTPPRRTSLGSPLSCPPTRGSSGGGTGWPATPTCSPEPRVSQTTTPTAPPASRRRCLRGSPLMQHHRRVWKWTGCGRCGLTRT